MRTRIAAPVALAMFSFAAVELHAQNRSDPASSTLVRELPADQQIIHALSRLTFGPRPGDVLKVRSIGLDKWIEQQLRPERIDDSRLEAFVARYPTINRDQSALLRDYAEQQRERREVRRGSAGGDMSAADSAATRREMRQLGNSRRDVIAELQSSRVARAVASERQLQEVMTDFWLNHFNVFAQKGPPGPFYLADFDRDVIRPRALGKFRDLLGAVAQSPAMLFYLDNARSVADSGRATLSPDASPVRIQPRPRNAAAARRRAERRQQLEQAAQRRRGGLNENYGRELLELHTLGVDGGYTQQDVINVARAFTGWTIRQPQQGGGFVFRPQVHDAGEKIVLGHELAAGRGKQDGDDVLDILSRSPVTAGFIATKIARRLVSDVPPRPLVDRAAATFLKTDGDIREVVRAIVTSPEFFSRQAFRSKVKSPFEVVVSAMRALDAPPDSTVRTAQLIAYLGQPIFGHQAPNGWPETGEPWMNTGAILNRINFGMAAAAGWLPGIDLRAIPTLDAARTAPREAQVDAVVAALLNGMASPDTRAVLMSGEHPLLPRAGEGSPDPASESSAALDSATSSGPEMSDNRNPVGRGGRRSRVMGNLPPLSGLEQIVGLALGSPEFQRR